MYTTYVLQNLVNNKVYVGVTKNLKARKSQHEYSLKKGTHTNKDLQCDWNKDVFKWYVVGNFTSRYEAEKREQEYIAELSDRCYNITQGGEGAFAIDRKQAILTLRLRPSEHHPVKKLRDLGHALRGYISPASNSYDRVFHELLFRQKPHWFPKGVEIPASMIAGAKSGILRFMLDWVSGVSDNSSNDYINVKRFLTRFTDPGSEYYDKKFRSTIKAIEQNKF